MEALKGGFAIKFQINPMEEIYASQIVEWHYGEPYTFYDFNSDLDDAADFVNFRKGPPDKYFSALDENGELVGFFEFTHKGNYIEIGLGMRPDLTGKGFGLDFLKEGLKFISERLHPASIRLKVAIFNVRAIKVYERAGFRIIGKLFINTNGSKYEFVEMELELRK